MRNLTPSDRKDESGLFIASPMFKAALGSSGIAFTVTLNYLERLDQDWKTSSPVRILRQGVVSNSWE